ncbi:hypothetical protein L9F63_014607 [Diploptera punctata]|uniref:Uncharacterized protein n=1 Tax=Diploptera punctata TaxID=6984 RepID=A0AAD8EKX7_DIPPU|nr:hypothetical protein L9F63_014607 [Diploptera punctata]
MFTVAECGLLTTYSVQLQGSAVDFPVQIKFQFLLLQFVRSLQNVLVKIPGQELIREVGTQTSEQCDFSSAGNVGSLVFTPTQDHLSWPDDMAQSKALATTTDIIVTCHPATLAAIVTAPISQPCLEDKTDNTQTQTMLKQL